MKNMKILLINPRGAFFAKTPKFIDFWKNSKYLKNYKYLWSGTSLGLLILASLTPQSFDIEFIDENFKTINYEKSYNLVAITAFTQQAIRAYKIADEFRKRGILVVIGGIHATLIPQEAKKHADSVVVGEAEEIWPVFIKDFLHNKPKPFYYNKKPIDLSRSPIPRYDILNHKDYKVVWVQTTRGCPRNCEFCASSKIFGNRHKYRKLEEISAELHIIKRIWGNPLIIFTDDNLFVNKKYSIELVKILRRLNIKWIGQSDLSIANDEPLLDLLRLNNCIFLFIGFESIAQNNSIYFENKNKLFKISNYQKAINKIQSRGIGIMGAFIIGFDNDDKSTFQKTTEFIINNHLYGAQITVLTPLPGTKLRERLELEKRILSNDWSNYTMLDVNFKPKKMSKEELQEGVLNMYRNIYTKEVQLNVAKHFKNIYKKLIN